MKKARVWLPMLLTFAAVLSVAAQEINAPEARWQSKVAGSSEPANKPFAMDTPLGGEATEAYTPPATQDEKKKGFTACDPSILIVNDRPNVAPLTVRGKFRAFYRLSYNPCRNAGVAFAAGISQAEDRFPEYGQGAQGYGKRLGANLADSNMATFFGRFLLPSLLHDDPRYFRIGQSGTFKRRLLHAILSPEWTRRDNGSSRFNYSRVLGDFMATSIGNVYYPEKDRGADSTFSRGGTMLGTSSATAVFEEFWPDIKTRLFRRHKSTPVN